MGAAVVVPTGAAAAIAVQFATQTIDWLKENEFDNTDESLEGIAKARDEGERNAMTPLLNWAEQHGMSSDEIWDLSIEAEKEHQAGGARSDTDNARGY